MEWRQIALGSAGTLLAVALVTVTLPAIVGLPVHLLFAPAETGAAAGLGAADVEYEIVAEELDVPWEVVVLDDGRFVISERTGALVLVEDGERHVLERFDELSEPFLGEGGLLGVAAHLDFVDNRYLYVYLTVDRENVEDTVRRFEVDLADRTETTSTSRRATRTDGPPPTGLTTSSCECRRPPLDLMVP